MRTLVLLRHAKTADSHPSGDKARELTRRGRADAAKVGSQLSDRGIELVLCSTAVRTRQTVAGLGLTARVEYMDALYSGGVESMQQRIREVDDSVTGLLVVGHSPTIPHLAAQLASADDPDAADQISGWFPTAAWAEFAIESSWADLGAGKVELKGVHRRD